MTILEMSLTADYRRHWGAWEGLRELISNGRDEEVEHKSPLTVTYVNDTQTLRIENTGATLSREDLLLGQSSKMDRTDTVGRYGEGLTVGTLALVRSGRIVKIRTGGEVWTASIARSEKYNANVLQFDCKSGNEDRKRVRVEVAGVTVADWEQIRERFLFLGKFKKNEKVETERGDLLLASRFCGKMFVRGVFVQDNPQLTYGYNFADLAIDIDRKMVDNWDSRREAGKIWGEAVARRPDLMASLFTLLSEDKHDVDGLRHYPDSLSLAARTTLTLKFKKQFGDNAIPVASMAESADVAHLGKRGVVVSRPLLQIITTISGDKDSVLKALREEVTATLSWEDLQFSQQIALTDALKLVTQVRPECTLAMIDVVTFRSHDLDGMFRDGRILIAARLLDDPDELLATIVHEFSHRDGADGDKDHVMAIENFWRDIVKVLRAGQSR